MATTKKKFAKAIVIGGSIAGMMAARAASDFCEHVTIVDRDELLSNPSIRQGAPHAVQPHTLLEGGRIIMEEFFPGLTQDLIDAGNIRLNATAGLKWFHHGVWKCDEAIDLELLFQSRIHLEKTMRSHILKSDNISFLKASIKSLDYDQENNRVTGVITGQASLKADIVVDASGRNSKLSTWLKAMNCHVPKTTEIPINIKYQSRLFYRDKADRTPIVIYPKAPEGQHCAYLFPVVDEHHGHCWLA
ncbi:MAG: hypothetical protein HRT88_16255, partial [Lentisphaeraceae bacterium]|nr:hypothetical protein [Lentisphaeraceae bacterium]